jgi:hypothetical protein
MASLPLQIPSPTTLRKSFKCPKRAAATIRKHLGNGTLRTVSKVEGRTVVSFYLTGRRCDWHNWGFDYKENAKTRKQPATTYSISSCVALVPFDLTPKVVLGLEADFAR